MKNQRSSVHVSVVSRGPNVKSIHNEEQHTNKKVYPSSIIQRAPSQFAENQSSLSKPRIIKQETKRLTKPSVRSLCVPSDNKSVQKKHFKNKAIDSTDKKTTRSKILRYVFLGFIGLAGLAGFIIGIYFLVISAQTPFLTTTPSTALTLRWQTVGITVAGTGIPSNAADKLYNPYGIVIDSSNTLYVADYVNNRIQKFPAGSTIGTTVAGQPSGISGLSSNTLLRPSSVLLDSSGNLYVSDTYNHRVQFFPSGALSGTMIAGTGSNGTLINELTLPRGLALDPTSGALYIADSGNHRVMSYLSNVSTVVAGGNGPGALNTQLNLPTGLAFDASSNSLYISNYNCHNIVRWALNATAWTIVAGSPSCSAGSTPLLLYCPTAFTFDYMGNLYVADYVNHRIQLFARGAFNGTTIAGVLGTPGSFSNLLYYPYSVALDSSLNLYVADTNNNRIQMFVRY